MTCKLHSALSLHDGCTERLAPAECVTTLETSESFEHITSHRDFGRSFMSLLRCNVQRPSVLFVGATALLTALGGCTHPNIRILRTYRDAKKSGDYTLAGKQLAANARIWFDTKDGAGRPLRARGGPYKDWDKEFKSRSTREQERVIGQSVTYVSSEINDYYRLIERIPTKARITYYFNDEGKISGMLYQGLSPRGTRPPDRYCEFKKWAAEHYPGLLDSDEMKIPNNPKRWRALLTEFRQDQGLPPIR